MHVHIDCAGAFVYMCVCVRCGRLYFLWNDMAFVAGVYRCCLIVSHKYGGHGVVSMAVQSCYS